MKYDCLVLGAGIVGVSAALQLQARGRTVALLDRGGVAEETSYGNAGIIQTEAAMPYAFPREFGKILDVVFNRSKEAHLHWSALPEIGPWLYQYWRYGTRERVLATAAAAVPLVRESLKEHKRFIDEAGAGALLRDGGYLHVSRNSDSLVAAERAVGEARDRFGIAFRMVDKGEVAELEPHLSDTLAGGLHYVGPASVSDPSGLGKAYAQLFEQRGGHFVTGDAMTLERGVDGWRVAAEDGPLLARDVVVSLGPWSGALLRQLGKRVPLQSKRGYHMHYGAHGNAGLSRPVLDADNGYCLAPMQQGIRLTTGVEFARRDAPPTPRQLERVEPDARGLFPLGERKEETPGSGGGLRFPICCPRSVRYRDLRGYGRILVITTWG